ncbi:MAG: holo-ACP synthase [Oceanospirillaceae bacterium]|nr:holo-ACP synthase [Oceanospirillaceae bacterium]
MVKAIGTDIVATARIAAALERTGRKFAQRILTEFEMIQFDEASNPAAFLAKRFAAKEAAAKALGTGIGRGISWQQIHIEHDKLGAPLLVLSGAAAQRQADLGSQTAHISIADELDQALAFVVLS